MKALVVVLALFILSSCAQKPTTVSESDLSLLERAYQFEKTARPIRLTPETIIIDVRSFFEFQMSHLPGAIHLDPKDVSLRRLHGDDLQLKAVKLSRRLALLGLTPFSHVVVVGYGDKGQGEEGLVALSLMILGIERVQLGTTADLKSLLTSKEAPQRPNARYWEPRLVHSLVCPPLVGKDAGFVINVGKKQALMSSSLGQIPMNWKDFIMAKDFSANPAVKSLLSNDGVGPDSRILVRGPQSPLVVFSLLQLGYNRACMMDD